MKIILAILFCAIAACGAGPVNDKAAPPTEEEQFHEVRR